MGFASSLKSWNHSHLKSLPLIPADGPVPHDYCTTSTAPGASSSGDDAHPGLTAHRRIPVMRANRSQHRYNSTSARDRDKETPRTALLQALPLPPMDAPEAPRQTLKIVQREPRMHPECLLISGRMADVCAALESMALAEQASIQVAAS